MRRLYILYVLPSLLLAPAQGRAEIIERVVAKVNGEIITLSDFQARQVAAAQAARIQPDEVGAFLRKNNAKILQEAIDDILIVQKAQDDGLQIRPEYIDEAIDSIKKDNNITTDEQMQEALAHEGLTMAELRSNIERSMTRRMMVEHDIRPKIDATDKELRDEYEKLKATEFTKPATVSLQEILVAGDRGGLPLAQQLVQRARQGEDFEALARTYSTAPSRSAGGEIGEIAAGDLHPDLESVAFSLPVGAVSDPLPVEGGAYRIIKVTAKTEGSTTPFEAAKEKVRDRLMAQRFEHEYDAYLDELRKTAVVELRVREVPLQLTGPISESSLLEALEPLTPGESPTPPEPASSEAPAGTTPAQAEEEISTTPQAAPEKVAPPLAPSPPATTEPPKESPPPGA
jgi:peptidyl-prolyl cis-trans isomerase SurA